MYCSLTFTTQQQKCKWFHFPLINEREDCKTLFYFGTVSILPGWINNFCLSLHSPACCSIKGLCLQFWFVVGNNSLECFYLSLLPVWELNSVNVYENSILETHSVRMCTPLSNFSNLCIISVGRIVKNIFVQVQKRSEGESRVSASGTESWDQEEW